ncbi:MAG TPA: alpha/beta fold hydrolase [Kofleriaceae bacterium]|nr:alpha/beta fold hydrolase [Kofleriaceae bacterium]
MRRRATAPPPPRTPPPSRWQVRRAEFEVALGGVQLRAMERAIALAAGVRAGQTPDGVAYWTRAGRPGAADAAPALPIAGIHGFGGDKETWLMLGALIPRARGLALIDLPGHGRSVDVPEDRASIRHHAEAALRVLDELGFERAVVCGNSMGGGVALRLAASWPDRVAGLVLVASVGRDVHDGGARAWITGDNPLIPREADIERFMELVLERPPPVGRAVIRHVVTQRARRADALHRLFRGFVLADGEAGVPRDLAAIRQPALVLHGEQDRIIDKRVAEDLVAALPAAELIVMRGVGHAPQLEAPRHTARIVERFARRLDGGPAPE